MPEGRIWRFQLGPSSLHIGVTVADAKDAPLAQRARWPEWPWAFRRRAGSILNAD
jgi:hypothetical protein